jgi:hypothetical protein
MSEKIRSSSMSRRKSMLDVVWPTTARKSGFVTNFDTFVQKRHDALFAQPLVLRFVEVEELANCRIADPSDDERSVSLVGNETGQGSERDRLSTVEKRIQKVLEKPLGSRSPSPAKGCE